MIVVPYPHFDDPAEQREYDLYCLRGIGEEDFMAGPDFAQAFSTWKSWGHKGDFADFYYRYWDWADDKLAAGDDGEILTFENYISEQSYIRDTVGHAIYLNPSLMYEE